MRTKLILVLVAALAVLVAYLGGLLPERSRRVDAEMRATALQTERDEARARLRTAQLLGAIIALEEVVQDRNYGQAEQLASSFFDAVGTEISRAADATIRASLTAVQAQRDAVTAALARTDPAVSDILHQIEVQLRRGLGYPVPGGSIAA